MLVPPTYLEFVWLGVLFLFIFGVVSQQGDVQAQNQANDENRPPQRRRQGISQIIKSLKRLWTLGFIIKGIWIVSKPTKLLSGNTFWNIKLFLSFIVWQEQGVCFWGGFLFFFNGFVWFWLLGIPCCLTVSLQAIAEPGIATEVRLSSRTASPLPFSLIRTLILKRLTRSSTRTSSSRRFKATPKAKSKVNDAGGCFY